MTGLAAPGEEAQLAREVVPDEQSEQAHGCTCEWSGDEPWSLTLDCPRHGYPDETMRDS